MEHISLQRKTVCLYTAYCQYCQLPINNILISGKRNKPITHAKSPRTYIETSLNKAHVSSPFLRLNCSSASEQKFSRVKLTICISFLQVNCHNPSWNSYSYTCLLTKSVCCTITSDILLRLQMRLCFVGAYLLWVLASQNLFSWGASAVNIMDELASGCTSSLKLYHEPAFSHILNTRSVTLYQLNRLHSIKCDRGALL